MSRAVLDPCCGSRMFWFDSADGRAVFGDNRSETHRLTDRSSAGGARELIIATRGRPPCERPALFPTSIIPGAQREHSRKPDWPQARIDQRFPDARKIELFARRPRKGWTVWGNDTHRFEEVEP